jgi:hypothetical protein
MQLQSALDLRDELLASVIEPFAAALVDPDSVENLTPVLEALLPSARRFAVAARRLRALPQLHRSVAIGIQKHGSDYVIAVRVQRQGLIGSKLLEHIANAARNEVDLRMIGRAEKRARRVRPQRATAASLLAATWHDEKQVPVLIGSSVSHVDVTAGTVGAFASKGGKRYLLSNNHVLADEDRADPGDVIVQPARQDGGMRSRNRIAQFSEAVPLSPTQLNFIDAALAELDDGVEIDPRLLREIDGGADRALNGVGPRELAKGTTVFKIGRTTGATEGKVVAFDIRNVVVGYETGNRRFGGLIEIESADNRAFSDGGDSGALVVDEQMQAVGLLLGGTEQGASNGLGLSFASPAADVLSTLGVTLLT